MEHLPSEEIKWYTKIWYDKETGKKFNTISMVWNEVFEGKWEWETNKHVVENREFTEEEFFNQY